MADDTGTGTGAVDNESEPAPSGPRGQPMRGDRRLSGQVFDHLRDEIVRGALPPGTPMAELDLCARLGVSRTPVREALIKLAEEGLVQIYPQRGTFVAPISIEAAREAQFVREHLECALVAEAVRKIDATSLREINEIIARQEQAQREGTPEMFYEADEAFHDAIARVSGHMRVREVVRRAKLHFDRVRYLSLQDAGRIPLLINQHKEIVEGLANCNETHAVAAMRRHLREVFRVLDALPAAAPPVVPATARRRRAPRQRPG
ncbi:MAG: GntR family transcriptional regulator [Azospirillaceae bacterium]|nr:GntR family transcriptional regulator [Azospirillaceae bacterium]